MYTKYHLGFLGSWQRLEEREERLTKAKAAKGYPENCGPPPILI